MKRFFLITLIIILMAGCAPKVTESKPKVFGASTSGMTVQYVDEKGSTVTNKKDDDDDEGCDSSCYLFHM